MVLGFGRIWRCGCGIEVDGIVDDLVEWLFILYEWDEGVVDW